MSIITTDRLTLREVLLDDSPFILSLISEAAWRQFISDHSITTLEETERYIEERLISLYKKWNYGLWLVELKSNQQALGICGLVRRPTLPTMDLGFGFRQQFWGQGYAYEAAVACQHYAHTEYHAETLLAITNPENSRSQKLLKKIGFQYNETKSLSDADDPVAIFQYNY